MGMESTREPLIRHQEDRSGTLLRNRYEIVRLLGEGGFASTYLANDHYTNQQCVIKELCWNKVEDWKFIELFEREARVLSNLNHPQIPNFIEFFTEPSETGSRIFLVQEFIDGQNLRDMVQDGKHFTQNEVLEIALAVTKILEYLHTLSPPIIHRDIKPSNIMIDSKGEVHLVDFGAVRDKVLHSQKTEAGGFTVVGTYGFMPFEQFQGKANPASDIYSLGATLLYLLSHKEPQDIDSIGSRLELEHHISVSPEFMAVLQKMLEHNSVDRYQSAAELSADLNALLEGRTPSILRTKAPTRSKLPAIAVAAMIFMMAIGLLIANRNHERQPVNQPTATAPVIARTDVHGQLYFDGKPIESTSTVHPDFWFRNEETGRVVHAQVEYKNGVFRIIGLEPGNYGVQTTIDHGLNNPSMYPGDFYSWTPFTVRENNPAQLQIHLMKVIHMTSPESNARAMPNWGNEVSEMTALPRSKTTIRWESLGENVAYDYSIQRMNSSHQRRGSVASGTVTETEVTVNLPASAKDEYYLLTIYARKDGRRIGLLMTHGENGLGWDYRFRVK